MSSSIVLSSVFILAMIAHLILSASPAPVDDLQITNDDSETLQSDETLGFGYSRFGPTGVSFGLSWPPKFPWLYPPSAFGPSAFYGK